MKPTAEIPAGAEDGERWLTMAEAAERGGVTERAVRNWMQRGKLQKYRTSNRYNVRVDAVELDNFLNWRKQKLGQTIDEVTGE